MPEGHILEPVGRSNRDTKTSTKQEEFLDRLELPSHETSCLVKHAGTQQRLAAHQWRCNLEKAEWGWRRVDDLEGDFGQILHVNPLSPCAG